MFWEDEKEDAPYVAPNDIVDVAFAVVCRCLPLDHAHELRSALDRQLPWLSEEGRAGVHQIHVAESGNGWMRPDDVSQDVLYLSRRTKLMLRLPEDRVADAEALVGKTLDIAGYELTVGKPAVRALTALPTLFARYVVADENADEAQFLTATAAQLREMGIRVKKMMCGKTHNIDTPDGMIYTRSLLVADLDPEESVTLQQQGIGPERTLGCGLFVPHKGIQAVHSKSDE